MRWREREKVRQNGGRCTVKLGGDCWVISSLSTRCPSRVNIEGGLKLIIDVAILELVDWTKPGVVDADVTTGDGVTGAAED
jgi:hypothetical protein